MSAKESNADERKITKRYLYKNQTLYSLIHKVKLWPSRTGILHGIKHLEYKRSQIHIITHCGEEFTVWNSKNSRSARWLRNRLFNKPCPKCKVPEWKMEKYSSTVFSNFNKPDKRG